MTGFPHIPVLPASSPARRGQRVAIIGAGVGGLCSAVVLASRGLEVTVLERAATPGGKMRELPAGDLRIDAGPTVFTMRWVFEQLCQTAGVSLDSLVTLDPIETLARHAWRDGTRFDLFADRQRSADAIGDLFGAREASGYLRFCEEAGRIFRTLDRPFMQAPRPSSFGLMRGVMESRGLQGLTDLWQVQPFTPMWQALKKHFRDGRLRQLFGRYATYCGSSPFVAPATLMLVAHVEQEGVWLVRGGMHRVAQSLAALAQARGARIRYEAQVDNIHLHNGRVRSVQLADGERIEVDAVVANCDVNALAQGLLGPSVREAVAPVTPPERSLSAITWTLAARTSGFPLLRHNVFFSDRYADEFDRIFQQRRLPELPTVYVCAQDRADLDTHLDRPERLLCLVNAPADGDRAGSLTDGEIALCEQQTFRMLAECGLTLDRPAQPPIRTTPTGFNQLFPATGGALYGRASHGWNASFRRPGLRTRIPGLYLAGGSAHPGPGVPMAALSGQMAAASLLADLPSIRPLVSMATAGGISTP